jgi:hypothetical protein
MAPLRKALCLAPTDIRPLLARRDGGLASDRIMVHGEEVGFMCRDEPVHPNDSGWQFTAGNEPEGYLTRDNLGAYPLNLIANYDPDIIPLLDARIGSAFERKTPGGPLVPTEHPELGGPPTLH